MAVPRAEIRPGLKEGEDFIARGGLGQRQSLRETIETPQEVISLLARVDKELPVRVGGVTLGPHHLEALVRQIAKSLGSGVVDQRISKLKGTLPPEFEALARWFGGQLGKLETPDGKPLFPKEQLYKAAVSFLKQLSYLAHTPVEFVPKPAPKEEILTPKTLEDAMEFVFLCERPDSVGRQLLNPLGLSGKGLVILAKSKDPEVDFTIPNTLLEILKTLKHPESEKVFRNWTLAKCSEENPEGVVSFLKALVNFTAFLDSGTHLELFEPPKVSGREQKEILLQPFRALLSSIQYAQAGIFRIDRGRGIIEELEEIKTLVKLRYAEVYSGRHQTSLYTVSPEALVPPPEMFTQLILSLIKSHFVNGENSVETAQALVKLIESVGMKEIGLLIAELKIDQNLQKAFIEEAKRAGLMSYPEAVAEAIKALKERPLLDVAKVNFAKIIDKGTTDLEIYVFTGTFGPFTKGHKDLLQKLLAYIIALPQEEGGDGGLHQSRRRFQRIVLIAPLTNVSNISEYKKSPAQVGPVDIRVGSILLSLAGTVDPNQVFLTTAFQPDTAKTRSLEESIRDTVRRLEGKIQGDLNRVGRVAGFKSVIKFVFGPDEIQWEDSPRLISPKNKQREKVTLPGSICISRFGWQLALLRELRNLGGKTGIEVLILAPGLPYFGSSRVIKEIGVKVGTNVEAAAQDYVVRHWGPEALERRQDISLAPSVPPIGEICQNLIEELEAS